MTTPPATRIPLGASWCYRGAVVVFAIILIAIYSINTWTVGIFDAQNALPGLVAALATAWAAWDAWRPRYGVLHYANGQWVLALGDVEYQGTIQLVIDLSVYLLVKFTPVDMAADYAVGRQIAAPSYKKQLYPEQPEQCREKWLHLEPNIQPKTQPSLSQRAMPQLPAAQPARAPAANWLAVRRAVFAHAAPPRAPAH